MVHKATDGVPRLINQVCDHALLLACGAGVRRIEPAHVEEAWADLQQLPTPWNAPAAPATNGVIEFGGLDDGPLEVPPIAGTIVAAENTDSAADPSPQATLVATVTEDAGTEDAETFAQLCHIQKLLADVQAEFQPAEMMGPEAEPVLETPHPFGETFAEEEVIADRYAAVGPAEKLPSACGRGAGGEGGVRSTAAKTENVGLIGPHQDGAGDHFDLLDTL